MKLGRISDRPDRARHETHVAVVNRKRVFVNGVAKCSPERIETWFKHYEIFDGEASDVTCKPCLKLIAKEVNRA